MDGGVPVTIVSGYLGAGKTTLVNHILSDPKEFDIAIIVNDMGEINIDADLIARESDKEGIVDLSNGCICCRLQDDLLSEARHLAETREFDYLLIESSGISEPLPVAKIFTDGTDSTDVNPNEWFQLDTMVTVLDTYGFWKEFDAGETLPTDSKPDDRPMANVLVEQIEFCDIIILNKCDMVPDEVLDEIEAVVEMLQPRAERIRTSYCEVDPASVLGTELFDFTRTKRSQGWKQHLTEGSHDHSEESRGQPSATRQSAAESHGVSSFVYREERPFVPERLADWLRDWTDSVVRAKGVCNVAGHEEVIGVSQAGPAVQAGPIGKWRSDDDRKTRLVFIGREMNEEQIRRELNGCLIDTGETTDRAADPFPL